MRRRSYNITGHVHFLTFSCYRRCQILTDMSACALLADAISTARDTHDLELWAYVFMPNHVHFLVRPRQDDYSIAAILKSIKGPFAKRLIERWRTECPHRLCKLTVSSASGPEIRVWQRGGGFDRNLYTYELIRRAVEYIEWNPVRKGLVADPMDWIWSSSRSRSGRTDVPLVVDAISWEQMSPELRPDHGVST